MLPGAGAKGYEVNVPPMHMRMSERGRRIGALVQGGRER